MKRVPSVWTWWCVPQVMVGLTVQNGLATAAVQHYSANGLGGGAVAVGWYPGHSAYSAVFEDVVWMNNTLVTVRECCFRASSLLLLL